jgi:hypothetical protein
MEQAEPCPLHELARKLEQSPGELGRLGLLVLDDLDERVRSVVFIDTGTHIHDWPAPAGSIGLQGCGDERVTVREWLRRQLQAEIMYQDSLAAIWCEAVEEYISGKAIQLPDHQTADHVPVRLGLAALRPAPEMLGKLVNWLCSVDGGEERSEFAHGPPAPARPLLRFTGTAGGLSGRDRLKAKEFRDWGVLVKWSNCASVLASYLAYVTAKGSSSPQSGKVEEPSNQTRGPLSKDRCALVLAAAHELLKEHKPLSSQPDAERQRAAFKWACENKRMNISEQIKALKKSWLPEWFIEDLVLEKGPTCTVEDLLSGTKHEKAFRGLVRNALTADKQRHPRQRASGRRVVRPRNNRHRWTQPETAPTPNTSDRHFVRRS